MGCHRINQRPCQNTLKQEGNAWRVLAREPQKVHEKLSRASEMATYKEMCSSVHFAVRSGSQVWRFKACGVLGFLECDLLSSAPPHYPPHALLTIQVLLLDFNYSNNLWHAECVTNRLIPRVSVGSVRKWRPRGRVT